MNVHPSLECPSVLEYLECHWRRPDASMYRLRHLFLSKHSRYLSLIDDTFRFFSAFFDCQQRAFRFRCGPKESFNFCYLLPSARFSVEKRRKCRGNEPKKKENDRGARTTIMESWCCFSTSRDADNSIWYQTKTFYHDVVPFRSCKAVTATNMLVANVTSLRDPRIVIYTLKQLNDWLHYFSL